MNALLWIASVEEQRGRWPEAERTLDEALRLDPQSIPALLKLARIANRRGEGEKSLALLLRARKAQPQDFNVLYAFGVLCLQMDLIKDGSSALEEAVRRNRTISMPLTRWRPPKLRNETLLRPGRFMNSF